MTGIKIFYKTQKEPAMAITFKSVGHFFATVFEKVVADIPKIQATEGVVETVSAAIPVYGPLAVPIEKAGYAVLGEIASVLTAGGAAAKAKLADAGLDTNVIATVEDLISKGIPDLTSLLKALK
jgi:uncharacterized Ntn-hydrolase superfamily protein